MVSNKNYNQNQFSQSIKFYKIIAITFLFLTLFLLASIIFMSSKSAEIVISTSSEPISINSSLLLSDKELNLNALVTSTIVEFSNTFYPEGEKTILAKAEGEVTLYNETEIDQPLVATTRLLNKDGILFRLKSRVNVPAKGNVKAEVVADEEGPNGNIEAGDFVIPGLREEKQSQIYAKSEKAMEGGIRKIGIIDEKDIAEAETALVEFLKEKGKESLREKFSDREGLYQVEQYTFENSKKIGEEADNFVLSGKATISAVFYDKKQIDTYAVDLLNREVTNNSEVLKSSDNEASLSIKKIDLAKNDAELNLSYSGLVSIDQNSRELQKIMFLGKSEDEVKRYVMAIPHVKSVEMNFKPVWMRTIPHVADNVEIIIREE
ncbi:MAG: hypothetical protein WC414_03120 [Patescibacteria group bacterium]